MKFKKKVREIVELITIVLFIILLHRNAITAYAGDFDNAEDFYNAYSFTGAYNAEDNSLYFGTNDTLTHAGIKYETIGKRIYFGDQASDFYIDLTRYNGYYIQELDTVMSGNTEYLFYKVAWDAVQGLFCNKYGYIEELMNPLDGKITLYVDDIMTAKVNGNRVGSISDIGNGTVEESGDVAYTSHEMARLWYNYSGQTNNYFEQYYHQKILFTPGKAIVKPGTSYSSEYIENWTNYAHYIYPDPEGECNNVEWWDDDSWWAEEEGIHSHVFTGYKLEEQGGDPIPGSWGVVGQDALGNDKYDYDYTPVTWEPVVVATSEVIWKIDYVPPVIYNLNDSYGWINFTLFLNPAAYDKAPDYNPGLDFSTLKSLKLVGGSGIDGVEMIVNDGVVVNTNASSMYLTYRNEGTHTITFEAEDYAGNITHVGVLILQDFTPPTYSAPATSRYKLLHDGLINGMYYIRTEDDWLTFDFEDQDWLSGIKHATLVDNHGDEYDNSSNEPAELSFTLHPANMVNHDMNESMYYDYFILTAYDRAGNSTTLWVQPYTLANMHWYRADSVENYDWDSR